MQEVCQGGGGSVLIGHAPRPTLRVPKTYFKLNNFLSNEEVPLIQLSLTVSQSSQQIPHQICKFSKASVFQSNRFHP